MVWQGEDHMYYRYAKGAKPSSVKPAPRDALWLKPSGGIMGATAVYAQSEASFGKRPHYKALWHVGGLVVARPETKRYVQEGKRYVQKPVAEDRHFLVFDAESGRPIMKVETDMRVEGVYLSPRFAGLLYSSGPYLEYLECSGHHCKPGRVEVDTGYTKITAACYDPKFERIAVCAGGSLFLYEGAPGDEDIVYLGHGSLEEPCDGVWIADDSTLLLSLVDGFYAVARFRWVH